MDLTPIFGTGLRMSYSAMGTLVNFDRRADSCTPQRKEVWEKQVDKQVPRTSRPKAIAGDNTGPQGRAPVLYVSAMLYQEHLGRRGAKVGGSVRWGSHACY